MFLRRYLLAGVLPLCLLPGVRAEEQAKVQSAPVKVHAAMRYKVLVHGDGKEEFCRHDPESQFSCLAIKVSGVDSDRLFDIFANSETTGGIYVTAGDQKYRIGELRSSSDSKYIIVTVTAPKGANQLGLVVGTNLPVLFDVPAAVTQRLMLNALFAVSKR